ncbi:MAG: cation:proton antiporter [Myxococcaceae bacterium]
MPNVHDFLVVLTLVLCVAAVTTVLFQRLRQPVVLGYILAGLIVGPYIPVPLTADANIVHILSELGVILLMFSLGLEFSLRKLIQVGPTAGVTAVIQCAIMLCLGFLVGQAFGWTTLESIFTGAVIAVSSTTIIAKAFDEQGIRGKLRELVVGVLIVEDLISVLMMATLTAVSTGSGLSAGALALTTGRLAAFLIGLVVVGLLVIPRTVRYIARLNRAETTLVASVGICFGIALLAHEFGYSVALGAFIAGSLVAESGEAKQIEHLIQPVRDMFAAIFFVSVGMLIDPALIAHHWVAVLVLTCVVILGKFVSVFVGAFLTGHGTRTSAQASLSLAQIGEFSFIIASLGLSLKATGDFLYPVVVAVSAITTLTTPFQIRESAKVAAFIDRKLPKPLQTYVTRYGTWIERLRAAPRMETRGAQVRKLVRSLLIDSGLLIAVIIGTALSVNAIAGFLEETFGLTQALAAWVVIIGGALLGLPFAVGVVGLSRRLGTALAEAALPVQAAGRPDLAAAPRRALLVSLQLVILLLVTLPIAAITQPIVGGLAAPLAIALLLGVVGFAFWRSAKNLHGHVRAGAQMVVEVLAAQSHSGQGTPGHAELEQVEQLLPGIGAPVSVQLEERSHAVGRSLAQLNLRGETGATVLAIHRQGGSISVPTADETLRARDVLALTGTREAVEAAERLLNPPVLSEKAVTAI